MRRVRRTAFAIAGAAALAALVGCATVPERPMASAPPAFRVVDERPLADSLDPRRMPEIVSADLVAPAGVERTYLVLDGSRAGARVIQLATEVDGGGRIVAETVVGPDGVPRPSERMALVAREGGFALLEVETPEEDSRSLFAEGLPFAPRALAPGAASEGSSPMRVVRISDGSSRAKGRAERSARIRGAATVELAGERLESIVVEVTFSANLDAARVRRTSELFVVPGRGVVAERWNERLVVLGLFPRSSGETVALVGSVHVGSPPLEGAR